MRAQRAVTAIFVRVAEHAYAQMQRQPRPHTPPSTATSTRGSTAPSDIHAQYGAASARQPAHNTSTGPALPLRRCHSQPITITTLANTPTCSSGQAFIAVLR